MKYLFQCSIGPVQDFIATARRSRDLWYGSWMLSELSKAAAHALANDELIFPAPQQPTDLLPGTGLNVANKVVAVVTDPPDEVGQRVRGAVKKRLYELRDNAFGAIKKPSHFLADLAAQQVDDLLEFYWVGVEFADGEQAYAQARTVAERTLAARKTTRNFSQFTVEDHLPKSSLDGARESVIAEGAYPSPRAKADEKQAKSAALYTNFAARPAERLSGVDLLKRLGLHKSQEASFDSTSHMAALPFLKHVDSNDRPGKRADLLAAIHAMLKAEGVTVDEKDGAVVFASRLVEWIDDKNVLKDVRQKHAKILKTHAGPVEPDPYYVLLVGDGDNMGATIDNQRTMAAHRSLSQALSTFATAVAKIVKVHDGEPIYAGGDDVMAYLPLDRAFACADALASAFHTTMQTTGFTTKEGLTPTLSIGFVVAHHLEPLSNTLRLARLAEKTAKGVPNKNALAIISSKRSGADRTIVGTRERLTERLKTMIDWHRDGQISAGAPYELQRLHLALGESGLDPDGLVKESLRIVERKRESGGHGMDEQTKSDMLNMFRTWLTADKVSLLEVAHEMILAKQFADANDLAGTPHPSKGGAQ